MRKMMLTAVAALTVAAAMLAGGLIPGGVPVAAAQDAAMMSCDQLWYSRNEIYARRGHCFRTARAQSVFGPGCFPPYGQLSGWEARRVAELQMWERRRGCP